MCFAYGFATQGLSSGESYAGVVLEYNANPEDVLIDTRYLTEDQLHDLYPRKVQHEIILKPGKRNL